MRLGTLVFELFQAPSCVDAIVLQPFQLLLIVADAFAQFTYILLTGNQSAGFLLASIVMLEDRKAA